MEEKENAPKLSMFTVLAFVVALVLCLVELDLLNTPVDALLQRGSAVLGLAAKPVLALWRWLP